MRADWTRREPVVSPMITQPALHKERFYPQIMVSFFLPYTRTVRSCFRFLLSSGYLYIIHPNNCPVGFPQNRLHLLASCFLRCAAWSERPGCWMAGAYVLQIRFRLPAQRFALSESMSAKWWASAFVPLSTILPWRGSPYRASIRSVPGSYSGTPFHMGSYRASEFDFHARWANHTQSCIFSSSLFDVSNQS